MFSDIKLSQIKFSEVLWIYVKLGEVKRKVDKFGEVLRWSWVKWSKIKWKIVKLGEVE